MNTARNLSGSSGPGTVVVVVVVDDAGATEGAGVDEVVDDASDIGVVAPGSPPVLAATWLSPELPPVVVTTIIEMAVTPINAMPMTAGGLRYRGTEGGSDAGSTGGGAGPSKEEATRAPHRSHTSVLGESGAPHEGH